MNIFSYLSSIISNLKPQQTAQGMLWMYNATQTGVISAYRLDIFLTPFHHGPVALFSAERLREI